jgi:tetratricopeptide (TPR) repeat protein
VSLAHHTQDRQLARAIKAVEDASEADDDDRFIALAYDFTRRYPPIAAGHLTFADALERKGQHDAALQAVDRAEQLGHDDGLVHFMRAFIYGQKGMQGKAIQEITYAANGSTARRYPEVRAEMLLTRAMMLSQWIQDFDQALRDTNEAVTLMPDEESYKVRGDVYRESGDLKRCLDDYTRAVQLSPNDPALRERRADVYEELGRPEQAAADRAEAAKVTPPQSRQAAPPPQTTTAPPQSSPSTQAAQPPQQSEYRPPDNELATAALIFAFLLPPLGLIFGIVARSQINRTGEGGRMKAFAAILISVIIPLMVLMFVFLVSNLY